MFNLLFENRFKYKQKMGVWGSYSRNYSIFLRVIGGVVYKMHFIHAATLYANSKKKMFIFL